MTQSKDDAWKSAVRASLDVMAVAAEEMGDGQWCAEFFYPDYSSGGSHGWSTNYSGPAMFVLMNALGRSKFDGLRFIGPDGRVLVWKHPEVWVTDDGGVISTRALDGAVIV